MSNVHYEEVKQGESSPEFLKWPNSVARLYRLARARRNSSCCGGETPVQAMRFFNSEQCLELDQVQKSSVAETEFVHVGRFTDTGHFSEMVFGKSQ